MISSETVKGEGRREKGENKMDASDFGLPTLTNHIRVKPI
jgi:hypothetical protein